MFRERLKSAREAKGLTQVELAEKIGVTRDLYNKYERTTARPNYENLVKLARELDVTVAYLLEAEDMQSQTQVLTAEEAKLLTLYRALDSESRQEAMFYVKSLSQRKRVEWLFNQLGPDFTANRSGQGAALRFNDSQQATIQEILRQLDKEE